MGMSEKHRILSSWADYEADSWDARMIRQIERNREHTLDGIEEMTAWAEKTPEGDTADLSVEHMERMVAVANRILRLRAQGRI